MASSASDIADIMLAAVREQTAIPAFNIPYHPMMQPVVQALADTNTFGLITVARLEWEKFGAGSPEAIRDTYVQLENRAHTRLHLDHCPVIDEDQRMVDYMDIIERAIRAGYDSVMVDGSRLILDENIRVTRNVVELAHRNGIPVEAELGAVLGHESGPLPPYEELFVSGRGFTDVDEAARFATATGVDWLSIAIGNIHGAISSARHEKKVSARLNLEHLEAIREATNIPLVLHGGSGIRPEYIHEAIARGIAKINVATAIRQPYEALVEQSVPDACRAVYDATVRVVTEELGVAGNAPRLLGTP